MMLALKIARHFKGDFRLTTLGKTFVGRPGRVFEPLAPFYLFQVDQGRNSRLKEERLFGYWDIFLNAIKVEAEGDISAEGLREVLYSLPEPGPRYDPIAEDTDIEQDFSSHGACLASAGILQCPAEGVSRLSVLVSL